MRLITMGFFITTSFNNSNIYFLLYLIQYSLYRWLVICYVYLSAMYVYYHFS